MGPSLTVWTPYSVHSASCKFIPPNDFTGNRVSSESCPTRRHFLGGLLVLFVLCHHPINNVNTTAAAPNNRRVGKSCVVSVHIGITTKQNNCCYKWYIKQLAQYAQVQSMILIFIYCMYLIIEEDIWFLQGRSNSFMIYYPCRILLQWSKQGGWDGQATWHAWSKREMHTGVSLENQMERDCSENLGLYWTILLKWTLQK